MTEFSPIVFGAGAFNSQYNEEPDLGDIAEVLQLAFDSGITTIDTAAAYGQSEIILGKSLETLAVDREKYQICTKCCRTENSEFIHSSDMVRQHFDRSLKRLKTDYVDILYVHDVEFGDPEDVLHAVATAFKLKDEGKARNVGISGLPLDVLLKTVHLVNTRLGRPLDAVLSYCNLTLQNDSLLHYKEKLQQAGVRLIFNASPLSMSLLRSRPTHSFHPAPEELKQKALRIAEKLKLRDIELADVATQFSFAQWDGPTVIGLRSTGEIRLALENRKAALESCNQTLWKEIQDMFGEWHNFLWVEDGAKKQRSKWEILS